MTGAGAAASPTAHSGASTARSALQSALPSALPEGTRLGEFEIRRVIGAGGFGIVYLAFDHALEREVAVKEYMPASLAGRTETMHVSLRSQADADTFELGLKSFVNEARLLARFDLPSLVKVHRFWEANGTAYMVMPVYRGSTLKQLRAEGGLAPDEAWVRALLVPLLDTLERLHAEGIYHRDIAPDNIMVEPDGRPVLLDLGAARRVISDRTQTLTAILKPAYAPIEQYAEGGTVRQGPWTDLYALGATLHFTLLGRPPTPATMRAVHDDDPPLATRALPGVGEAFARVIDWMLAPRPMDRPQDVDTVRRALAGELTVPVRPAVPGSAGWDTTVMQARPGDGMPVPGVAAAGARAGSPDGSSWSAGEARGAARGEAGWAHDGDATVVSPAAAPAGGPTHASAHASDGRRPGDAQRAAAGGSSRPANDRRAAAAPPPVPPPAARSRTPLLAGLGVLALAVAVGAGWWLRDADRGGATASPVAGAPNGGRSDLPGPAAAALERIATLQELQNAAAPRSAGVPETLPPPGDPAAARAAPAPAPAPAPASVTPRPAPTTVAAPRTRPAETSTAPSATAAAAVPAGAPSAAPEPRVEVPPPMPASPSPTESGSPALGGTAATGSLPAAAALVGPRERCGRRVAMALWRCMERECQSSELRRHAECVQWREESFRPALPQ